MSDAVRLARPGDLVLVAPGTYRESVHVTTPGITVRGESRAGVVIDGDLRRRHGIVVTAPGVSVENLTVQRQLLNGVLVTGAPEAVASTPGNGGYGVGNAAPSQLSGFAVRYVTASNNGLYGVYAFSARDGVIERSYASGSADSGFYVGQCKPCHISVRDNVAERNAVGYEGTNASGPLTVTGNRLVGNRVGATTNANHLEKLLPQQGAAIAGNLIAANQQPDTPAQADGGFGLGLGIAGGTGNTVTRNLITGNPAAGVVVASSEDLAPRDNTITGNVLHGNGADLAFASAPRAPGAGNCVRDNLLATLRPAGLRQPQGCAGGPDPVGDPPRYDAPPGLAFSRVAAPPPQPDMPGAATAGPSRLPATPQLADPATVPVPGPGLLETSAAVRS
jgi:hypothetical protein